MAYTTDFETTTDMEDCRVWAWAIMDIDTLQWEYGNDIETYLNRVLKMGPNTFYFHNLKFDSQFLISHLLNNGWKWTRGPKVEKKEFSTVISDKGQYYVLTLGWKNSKGKTIHIKFQDSLKLIPFSVEKIAKDFKLDVLKGKIDYTAYREVGHKLTDEEISYLKNDVEIMAKALKIFFSQGLDKITIGSNAMAFYKNLFGKKNFDRHFPKLQCDSELRQSYKGGWTYLKDEYAEQEVCEGIVLDVNSLYPWVMHDCLLPFGEPKFFVGKYEYDKFYPLHISMISCQFELKEGYLPTIQLKHNLRFMPTEYLKSSNGEEVVMCMTSVDLDLFLKHYDVYCLEYISGWKFRGSRELFKEYIDYWVNKKIDNEKNGNNAGRTIDKLYLNNLYGKFGKNPKVASKMPVIENGIVKYKILEPEIKDAVYLPVAAFVTAHARYKTITSAQSVYDRFIYADTDSLHLLGCEIPEGLEIDPYKLGAWKHESTFRRARFIRQKSYIEDTRQKDGTYSLKVTCAGLPKDAIVDVTWDNFKTGFVTGKSLKQKIVKGGAVLVPTTFEIKA